MWYPRYTDLGTDPYFLGYFIKVRISGPTFSTLFIVRIRFSAILDCDITFKCVNLYGEKRMRIPAVHSMD